MFLSVAHPLDLPGSAGPAPLFQRTHLQHGLIHSVVSSEYWTQGFKYTTTTAMNSYFTKVKDTDDDDDSTQPGSSVASSTERRSRLCFLECTEEGQELEQLQSFRWNAQPYKKDILTKQLEEHEFQEPETRRHAIIESLCRLGVQVYVVENTTTRTILQHVQRVVKFVSRENARLGKPFQRVILYQDDQGRLFNLTFRPHSVGPVGRWVDYLDSFSVTEAIVALMVLCRSIPCIIESKWKKDEWKC